MNGLLSLLDDVVALTKLASAQAAQAGAKAAGVVIDDIAVIPRYISGLAAQRELPIIARIAIGSLKNKLLLLLPTALMLSSLLPQAITPLLMVGGLYLCFEGYEKLHHFFASPELPASDQEAEQAARFSAAIEDQKVAGAIRTDSILSAEIMAIALGSITTTDLVTQALTLTAVAVLITAGVYGLVALIVKADDVGVRLARRGGPVCGRLGRALVYGMPTFLEVLSFVGMLAMLWVGGGILVHGLSEYGITSLEHPINVASGIVRAALPLAGGVLAWLIAAAIAAVIGLMAGVFTGIVLSLSGAASQIRKTGSSEEVVGDY